MESSVDQNSKEILENKNVNVLLNKSIYNLFVSSKNMKRDMVLPLTSINSNIPVENLNRNSANQESYTFNLVSGTGTSRQFIRQCDVTITANNVYTSQGNIDISTNGTYFNNINSVSNPLSPPCFGFRTDPLNSAVETSTIKLGANGIPVTVSYNPIDVNINRKKIIDKTLLNSFNGLLRPETYSLNTQFNITQNSSGDFSKIDTATGTVNNTIPSTAANTVLYRSKNLSFADLEQDNNNMLSYLNRGAIFSKAKYSFSKAIPSPNYIFNATTHTFVPTAPSTQLFTAMVGGYVVPTNISNWQDYMGDENNNPDLMIIAWFADKQFFAPDTNRQVGTRIVTAADPTANPPVAEVTAPVYANKEDFTRQRLNITVTIPEIQSPILNPLAEDLPKSTIAQSTYLSIELKLHADLFNSMCTFNYNSLQLSNAPGQQAIGPVFNLTMTNKKVFATQFDLGLLESSIQNIITIPYMITENAQHSVILPTSSPVIGPNGNNFQQYTRPVVFQSTKEFTNGVSKYFEFYCTMPTGFNNNGPLSLAYNIIKVEASLNNRTNIILQDMRTLFEATRANGVRLTSQDEHNNYFIPALQRGATENSGAIPGQSQSLFLEFGKDIPLPEDVTPGLVGSNLRITWTITCEFTLQYSNNFENVSILNNQTVNGNFIHYSEYLYNISNNRVDQTTSLYTTTDLVDNIKIIKNDIDNNKYKITSKELYGGNMTDISHFKKHTRIPTISSYHHNKPSHHDQPTSQPVSNKENRYSLDFMRHKK